MSNNDTKPEDEKKEDDSVVVTDHHPFGDVDVGPIVASHPCWHDDRYGDIHIGENSVCFRSTNFFGFFEQGPRIVIPWDDVKGLKQLDDDVLSTTTTTTTTKGGICILRKDGSYLDFVEIQRRDEVFELMKFHSDNVESRKAFRGVVLEEVSKQQRRASVGRSSFIGGGVGGPIEGFEIKLIGDGGSEIHRSMMSRQRIVENDNNVKEASEAEYVEACLRASMVMVDDPKPRGGGGVAGGSKSKRNLLGEMKSGKISKQGHATAQKYGIGIPDDLSAAWEETRDSKTPSFVEVGIEVRETVDTDFFINLCRICIDSSFLVAFLDCFVHTYNTLK